MIDKSFFKISTPSYVIDEDKLLKNLKILKRVRENTGCEILLAQKAFSCFPCYSLMKDYLSGTTASGLYEAKLGKEYMGGETHVYAPAFKDEDFEELTGICDHISFNSFSQLNKYKDKAGNVSLGIRINPEVSTGEHEIYDPCGKGSRLGVRIEDFLKEYEEKGDALFEYVEGIHFHTLCEQDSKDLETALKGVEEKFGKFLHKVKWVNFGGGHHITRDDYDIELLERLIIHVKDTYDVKVYLEPGEAIALNAGYLVSTVLDIVKTDLYPVLILDASAACHMPDVLEMPYRPPLYESGMPDEKKFTYRLSSFTCLAGDIIGDYSFDEEIKVGDRLLFLDMAIYSMVKNNTFNGIPLPSIALKSGDDIKVIKEFGYEDFKNRLG